MRERENARVAEQTFNAAMAAAQAEMEPPSVTVLRGASRYPMSEGSVLRSCLDPPQRSVRTSAADLRSNRPGTDYRVDPLSSRVNSLADQLGYPGHPSCTENFR